MPDDRFDSTVLDVEFSPTIVSSSPKGGYPHKTKGSRNIRWLRAALLLVLTFVCTTILGPAWYLGGFDESMVPLLMPSTVKRVLSSPQLLAWGLQFSLSLLVILGSHELGHFFACRKHRIHSTLPYFIPAPLGLGTFGAFIRVAGPIATRRQLFDVGVMGPIAGFVALVPFLLLGVAKSTPLSVEELSPNALLVLPGMSLGLKLATSAFHQQLAGEVLVLHPFALAAWAGMLITALNLLPMAQLDGGHIFYATSPALQRRFAWPLWSLLLVAGGVFWFGWWLWAAIVLIMKPKHPRLQNEHQPLDGIRRWGVLFALMIFVFCFMPSPVTLHP